MGYYETVCQLCGVSFAIARLRRADEPREAAWCYYGSEYVEADGDFDQSNELCGENSGCTELVPEELDGEGDLGEHLSGPGCTSRQGYSGQRISLDEMKGCRAVQCILKKGKDWLPEPDDQDFELESDYFLTGVGDGSPDEAPLRDIKPERHGVGEVMIDNLYVRHLHQICKHEMTFPHEEMITSLIMCCYRPETMMILDGDSLFILLASRFSRKSLYFVSAM